MPFAGEAHVGCRRASDAHFGALTAAQRHARGRRALAERLLVVRGRLQHQRAVLTLTDHAVGGGGGVVDGDAKVAAREDALEVRLEIAREADAREAREPARLELRLALGLRLWLEDFLRRFLTCTCALGRLVQGGVVEGSAQGRGEGCSG